MAEQVIRRIPGRGRFITFEGGEGSGKSTHIKKLAERLEAAKLHVLVTREPGGSVGAEIIRHLVLSGMGKLLGADAETLLFAAARDDHVRNVILPALNQGTWVLCDRFFDSTRAYQGKVSQVASGLLNAMERVTIGDLKPDLTIILDVPVEIGLKRAAVRRGNATPDRFESEDIRFHQELREAYREIAAAEPQRCVLIDASGDANAVATSVWAALRAETLAIEPSTTVARQIASGSHGGLLSLERTLNDRGVLRTVITVDETRETISFFGSTAAVEGWRVCIVDTVDELNPNAANALLKILEEPPQQSLFLLLSHAPARVLPTIQSRCRKLPLRPLATEDVIRAAAQATSRAPDDPALMEAAAASEGSVAHTLTLMGGDALKLHQRTAALLATLPRIDPRELHALGDALGTSDRVALAAFVDSIERWIAERLRVEGRTNANLPRLARLAEVWEKIVRAARDTEAYNLERKPLVFSVFGMLAEATR